MLNENRFLDTFRGHSKRANKPIVHIRFHEDHEAGVIYSWDLKFFAIFISLFGGLQLQN